jgi:hypothetical protein
MAMSYGLHAAQVNEESPLESSLNLTLTQHPHDGEYKPQDMRAHLGIEPLQTWDYHISLNFRTFVILLQIDPAFGDEPEIVYERYYEIEDTYILAWSLISGIGHYRWLHGPIR